MIDRFKRTQLLLGEKGLKRLKKAHVLVVGCGAVGGYAIEALARSGVGQLTVVDFDVISKSNINRQILALDSTVGKKKTEAALRRIMDINPDCHVQALDMMVGADTVQQIVDLKPDFVIDAIDSLNSKVALIEALQKEGISFISSMGAALRTNPADIQITTCKKTINCPLAFFIRKRLRHRGVDLNFPVVYSKELTHVDCFAKADEPNQKGGRVRHQLGSLPTITGIFGLMCANYVIMNLVKDENG